MRRMIRKKERRGRPRKPVENEAQAVIREMWRESSNLYYRNNREKVLRRAREKSREKEIKGNFVPEPLVILDPEGRKKK